MKENRQVCRFQMSELLRLLLFPARWKSFQIEELSVELSQVGLVMMALVRNSFIFVTVPFSFCAESRHSTGNFN
jgi:hypothetical protein